jgi:Ser/Thr protein kinase RdoA (MazF antagonist)
MSDAASARSRSRIIDGQRIDPRNLVRWCQQPTPVVISTTVGQAHAAEQRSANGIGLDVNGRMRNGADLATSCFRPSTSRTVSGQPGHLPCSMMRFEDRSQRGQVQRLRTTALDALRQYPIDVAGLRLLNHGFNTTFRVDAATGDRFALRINVNSRRSPAFLRAEAAWLAALSDGSDLRVPTPQPTVDGRLVATVPSADLGRDLPVVLFSWLDGPNLGESPTLRQTRAVGRAAATLHAFVESWSLPPGTDLPRIDQVLMDSPDNLTGNDHPLLTTERRSVIDAAFTHVQDQLDELLTGRTLVPIHADLHGWNLKWHAGSLSVFDFDDCGLGIPMQDLAISAYYLRDDLRLEAAMKEGYAEARPLPTWTADQFEAMVASRNLVLLNDLFTITTAAERALLPRYLANTVTKLRRYLDTGVYRHDVPDLLPTS